MKNDQSSEQKSVGLTYLPQQSRKIVFPPKSVELLHLKKSKKFINNLQLKSEGSSKCKPGDQISQSSISPGSTLRSENPAGIDSFALTRSTTESNLCESEENLENCKILCDRVTLARTQSLETITNMPAYGDLIIDLVKEEESKKSSANKTTERKDHLYKILVIGDLGAGKTSIIKRYVHRFFTQHYRATIGVDFALKVLNWDENTLIRLQLWDIAGQERYGNMTRVYYKEAVGAFIVFDVTRVSTFESVAKWKSDLDSKVQLPDGSPIPCVLLANKCDQPKEGLVNNPNKMNEYCKENNFTTWFETSAKDNINIDEAAKALVAKILENDALLSAESAKDDDKLTITKEMNAHRKDRMCSC